MKVPMHGRIRKFIGRWVMRMEASGQILNMVFSGTTAISALSGVLAYTGFQSYVPYILAIGGIGIFGFAFAYVELGLYNMKNREKQDRGNNFAKPQNRIDDELISRGVAAGMHGRPLSGEELDAINSELDTAFRKYRSGLKVED